MASMVKITLMAKSRRIETSAEMGGKTRAHPVVRPKPAGTLLILDVQNGRPHVLMGRRHTGHVFMPDVFVFPGGRVDRPDNHAPFHNDLTTPTLQRLMSSGLKSLATHRRARAFALAAIRETYEEVGMLIGAPSANKHAARNSPWTPFLEHGFVPDLKSLRYVARAVTPPGLIRRYDTRFFTVPRTAVNLELSESPTDELGELSWVPLNHTDGYKVPNITGLVLNDVSARIAMEGGIQLRDDQPVPVYQFRHGRHHRHLA